MNPVAIQFGPFSIRWYAICIVFGLILAVILAMKEAPRKGIESDDIIDFILIAFPVSHYRCPSLLCYFSMVILQGKSRRDFCRMERWDCYLWWTPGRGSSPLPIFTQSFD